MGKDKGARRERKSEGGGGASLKMVVGTCVWPACVVRAAAEQSARDGKEMRALKGTYVMTECTNRECTMGGKMHIECYEKLEHSLLGQKGLCGGAKSNLSMHEAKKALWTSKYDIAARSCKCACGKGKFKPRLHARGTVCLEGEEDDLHEAAAEKRRQLEENIKKQQATTPSARSRRDLGEFGMPGDQRPLRRAY